MASAISSRRIGSGSSLAASAIGSGSSSSDSDRKGNQDITRLRTVRRRCMSRMRFSRMR